MRHSPRLADRAIPRLSYGAIGLVGSLWLGWSDPTARMLWLLSLPTLLAIADEVIEYYKGCFAAMDARSGRPMNVNLAEYRIPVNADVPSLETILVEEHDPHVNALGIKGVGEIGITDTAGAVNAV